MSEFISKFAHDISGVITGFDRLVFRGHLPLNHDPGMKGYQISAQVQQASVASMEACQRPVRYLRNGKESKEEMARLIARQDAITDGPICAFTATTTTGSIRRSAS